MTKQLKSLFGQLASELKMPTSAKFDQVKKEYEHEWLKLDFAPLYGGYRLDIVEVGTGERYYSYSNRLSAKEMVCYIQGILQGLKPIQQR